MLPMSFGAVVRGARPAAIALVVLAVAACAIVLFVDRPVLDDAGSIGRTYDLAQAQPATGFYLESLGAALALVGAVAALFCSMPAGNPAGPSAHYLTRCPIRCRSRPPRPRRRPRRVRGAGASATTPLLLRSCRRMVGDQGARRRGAGRGAHRDALARPPPRRRPRSAPWLVGIGLNACRTRQLGGSDPLRRCAACTQGGLTPYGVGGRRSGREFAGRVRACDRGAADGPARGGGAVLPRRPDAGRGGRASRHPAGRGQDPAAQGARVAARAPRAAHGGSTRCPCEMQVTDVRRAGERHILMLEGGGRELKIWVGPAEAIAIAVLLEDVELPRPGTAPPDRGAARRQRRVGPRGAGHAGSPRTIVLRRGRAGRRRRRRRAAERRDRARARDRRAAARRLRRARPGAERADRSGSTRRERRREDRRVLADEVARAASVDREDELAAHVAGLDALVRVGGPLERERLLDVWAQAALLRRAA